MKGSNKILITILFILCSCGTNRTNPSSEVTFLSKKGEDIIAINAVGYGYKKIEAIKNAEQKVFEILLFMGLANSEYRDPLIKNEKLVKQTYSQYFELFFENEGYKKFIVFSKPSLNHTKKDKQSNLKKVSTTLNINIHSLRKDLEKNGIIKKFGF
ncbi:MAG: hypothetical protein ACWA45_04540 [Flavobacteriales bacterium]